MSNPSDDIMGYIRELERRAFGPSGRPEPGSQPALAPDAEAAIGTVRRGQAVCLALNRGGHLWIVADEEDAELLRAREPDAVTYDLAEVSILVAIDDLAIVKELHEFKRLFRKGRLRLPE